MIALLHQHGIRTRRDGNRIEALDTWRQDDIQHAAWIDVTRYTTIDLLWWLGYDRNQIQHALTGATS